MPDCIDCSSFNGTSCLALPRDWPLIPVNLIRACVVAINQQYCSLIVPGMRVLEIGCGSWSPIRVYCDHNNALWDGIDVAATYLGKPTIATRIESVEELSFPDQSFDVVIANQSLEHWIENGTRLELGLWQCFRVCKTGGQVLMNVPIHFHGARIFVEGDLRAIEELFLPFADVVSLEAWRRNSEPLESVYLIPKCFTHGFPSHVLDIRVTRNKTLPARPKPYRVRNRIVRELLDHRLSFLYFKTKFKMRQKLNYILDKL